MASSIEIKTRFLVISDTHGQAFPYELKPLVPVDVAIHCGDITNSSTLQEFKTGLRLLEEIDAPLKLVIAGNHDFTLDTPIFKRRIAEVSGNDNITTDDIKKGFGYIGEARQLLNDAKSKGIMFLTEGTHRFKLQNGALLTVYASPYTPWMSALDEGAFQYDKEQDQSRQWSIGQDVDVVITHGPPKGIFDRAIDSSNDYKTTSVGSASLFKAIFQARPKMHCFGHIHRAWGAKLITWRDIDTENATHFNAIDNAASHISETLDTLHPRPYDTPTEAEQKHCRLNQYQAQRYCMTKDIPKAGDETMFVNASIEGDELQPVRLPWVVEIGLPGQ